MKFRIVTIDMGKEGVKLYKRFNRTPSDNMLRGSIVKDKNKFVVFSNKSDWDKEGGAYLYHNGMLEMYIPENKWGRKAMMNIMSVIENTYPVLRNKLKNEDLKVEELRCEI